MHLQITDKEFKLFQALIYKETGISLHDQKATMVQARLAKRVRDLNLDSFEAYYDYLQEDENGEELLRLLSAISTNVTSFFREAAQWDFLEEYLAKLSKQKSDRKLRIWSAACSAGQEPYSIAIFLHEHLKNIKDWDIKFLASDIDTNILAKAMRGEYKEKDIAGMPRIMIIRYFDKIKGAEITYRVKAFLREMIIFRMFNLVRGDYSLFKNKFDIIFCRNVMIYFDSSTREELIKQLHQLLRPGGILLLGHSESITRTSGSFKLVRSAIYERI